MSPISAGCASVLLWRPSLPSVTVASVPTAIFGKVRDRATYTVIAVDLFYAENVAVSKQELNHGFTGVRVLFGGPFAFEVYGPPCCMTT
jgi:hypothetical protein